MNDHSAIRGVVHGNMIQFERDLGLPEGEIVSVTVHSNKVKPNREGLQKSFGACADEADDLDEFLIWNRQQRKSSRPEIES